MSRQRIAGLSGAFGRDELCRAGVTDAEIRILRHEETLLSFRRGIYVSAAEYWAADEPGRHALRVQSLIRAMSKQNIAAAGPSAAQIHGISLLTKPRPLYVVTDDPGVCATSRDGYVLRVAPLAADDACVLHGTRVTTAERTLLDLLCELDFVAGVVSLDCALRAGRVTKAGMSNAVTRSGGRPGVETARQVIAFANPLAESPLESASWAHLHLQGIEPPELQVYIFDDVRVDGIWRIGGRGVIADPDGVDKYIAGGPARTREVVARDLARTARIVAAGFVHLRWGWAELDEPARLAATVRSAFVEALRRSA